MTNTHRGVDIVVTGERDIKTPLQIMSPVSRSHLARSLLLSFVAHVLLIGLTSFGLYADWMRFGMRMPQELKRLKKQAAIAELDAQREAERSQAAEPPVRNDGTTQESGPSTSPSSRPAVPDVVRDANAVNTDRPKSSSLKLDEELGLE